MFDREYLKRIAIYIGASVAALTAAFLLGYHIWLNATSDIETIAAVPKIYSVTADYDAWVFRDETVLTAPEAGTVVPNLRNGEKTAKNDPVAFVYSSVPADRIAELASVRSQIRLLESKRSTVISGDLGISEIMPTLTSALKNGSLSSVGDISSRLTALVAARAAGGGDASTVIGSLEAKEQEIISSFGTSLGSVYAPVSGWYYSDNDGFETIFTTNAVTGISPEGLDALLESEPIYEPNSAGRIMRTHKWYIASNMDTADALLFSESSTAEIRVSGLTDPIKFKVDSIVNGSDNRSAVVFSCETLPENYSPDRHITPEFILKEVEGFGIPKEAVRVLNGCTGVFTYNGFMATFKKINILEEIDDMYIAEVQKEKEETTAPQTSFDVTADAAVSKDTPVETTTAYPIGSGTGRNEYLWLDVNDFIIVKGKALKNGKLIG